MRQTINNAIEWSRTSQAMTELGYLLGYYDSQWDDWMRIAIAVGVYNEISHNSIQLSKRSDWACGESILPWPNRGRGNGDIANVMVVNDRRGRGLFRWNRGAADTRQQHTARAGR